jgi:hypothetical protein
MALQLFQRLRLSFDAGSPGGDQKQCRVFQLSRHKSTVRQLSQTDRQIEPSAIRSTLRLVMFSST